MNFLFFVTGATFSATGSSSSSLEDDEDESLDDGDAEEGDDGSTDFAKVDFEAADAKEDDDDDERCSSSDSFASLSFNASFIVDQIYPISCIIPLEE